MLTRNRRLLSGAVLPVFLLSLAVISTEASLFASTTKPRSLGDKVRHELVMLPYYGVFDNLSYKIEGADTVVLAGQVTRPTLKSSAETVVRKVVNDIEVLPLSPMDDSIRLAAYRAIFFQPGFESYAIQAISPIRIIVKNGNITLEGAVASQVDKSVAVMAARSVPFVFSVTDNLTIG
jgi:hyperosmotically inducible protein